MTEVATEQVVIGHWPVQEMLLAYGAFSSPPSAGIMLIADADDFLLQVEVQPTPFTWSWLIGSAPPTTTIVPDVRNYLFADGILKLALAGLTQTPPPTFEASSTVPTGYIIAQFPIGGSIVPFSTQVALLVSTGPVAGFRVMAVNAGFYGGSYYRPGDVFDLLKASDFSDSTIDYGTDPVTNQFGWMRWTDPSTPLFQAETNDTSPFYPVDNTGFRTVY